MDPSTEWLLRRVTEERRSVAQEKDKARLLRLLEKKLATSFIGALYRFEQFFGELWGHGLPANACTPEQLAFREVWQEARTEVLNNGNNQLRAVTQELASYDIKLHKPALLFQGVPGAHG